VLVPLITSLSQCLSSNNASIRASAQASFDLLFQYSDPQVFIPALVNTIQYSNNSRVKPVLLERLILYLPGVRKNLALKYIVPLANKLINDAKSDLRIAATTILQKIHA
jgi:hypothetical protein